MGEKAMNITVQENVYYGSHERHILDLYLPQTPKTDCGLILFIHGGGWTSCDKTAHTADCKYWSEKGYICATMNYRYVDSQLTVFDELDDVTAALEKIKSICNERGRKLKRTLLSGGSAGAHLSLMCLHPCRRGSGYTCGGFLPLPAHPLSQGRFSFGHQRRI